jgi:hypothetical protein
VTNNGPAAADRVTVSDPLPAGLTVSSAGGEGFTCVVSGSTVRCVRASLASGATATVTINAVIGTNVTAGQKLTNVATVATATLDPTSTNDSASQVLEIAPLPPTGGQPVPLALTGLAILLLGAALIAVGLRRQS